MLPLGGCLLAGDKPEPGIDIPQAYDGGPRNPAAAEAAVPPLDWWRRFRSRELTDIVEEARAANLDIAAAVARIVQADAQARIAGAALLPDVDLNGSATRSRASQTLAGRPAHPPAARNATISPAALTASYEIDFWGKNRAALRAAEETAVASRYDREVVGLDHRGQRRQCLFPGAGRAGPLAGRAREHRQRHARAQSDPAAPQCRHRLGARNRRAAEPGRHPARRDPAARTDAQAEPQRAGGADRALARACARARRLACAPSPFRA